MHKEFDDLYPCQGCGKWCVPAGMTPEGQALCYTCQELYTAEGGWEESCEHQWVPRYEGCDHYVCKWCGQFYPPPENSKNRA